MAQKKNISHEDKWELLWTKMWEQTKLGHYKLPNFNFKGCTWGEYCQFMQKMTTRGQKSSLKNRCIGVYAQIQWIKMAKLKVNDSVHHVHVGCSVFCYLPVNYLPYEPSKKKKKNTYKTAVALDNHEATCTDLFQPAGLAMAMR